MKIERGFAPIIFILGILIASGLIVGGAFYLKNSYPELIEKINQKKEAASNINEVLPEITNSQNTVLLSTKATVVLKKLGTASNQQSLNTSAISTIKELIFSGDSNRFAYQIINPSPMGDQLVLDGQIVKRTEDGQDVRISIGGGQALFSPDSRKFAYVEYEKSNLYRVVVNGQVGKSYETGFISDLTFSPDNQHFAYVVDASDGSFVVVDGKESKRYRGIGKITFSPDSQRIAYRAKIDEKHEVAVVDGQERNIYFGDGYRPIDFSPDSKTFVYTTSDGTGKHSGAANVLVVNGEEKQKKDYLVSNLTLSPDSAHIAYLATAQDFSKQSLVLDGKEQEIIGGMVVSPDSRSLQFSSDSQKVVYLLARGGNETSVIVDSKEQARYPESSYVYVFSSPDNKNIVSLVTNAVTKKYVLAVNGKEAQLDFSPNTKKIFFSPDGKRAILVEEIYGSGDIGSKVLHIFNINNDGSISKVVTQEPLIFHQLSVLPTTKADQDGKLIFSQDSKMFTFGAAKDKDVYKVEVTFE